MKTLMFAGLASACLLSAANAADLPSRRAPPVYVPPPVPVFTWTGIYLGGNAGYAWTDNASLSTSANDSITASQLVSGTVPGSVALHSSGFSGGGQVGYNYQLPAASFGGVVLGVEADAAYTDLDTSRAIIGNFGVPNTYRSHLDYLGTVRGRLGIAVDRVLVYGTGGFAYGRSSLSQGIYPSALPPGFPPGAIWAGSRSGTQTGYAVGAGVEYALPIAAFGSGAVTLKLEYLHYDLGTQTVALAAATYGPADTSFTDRIRTAGNIVRGGINYKFDFAAPAPVVARY